MLGWSAAGQALLAAGFRGPADATATQAAAGAGHQPAGAGLSELISWHLRPRPPYAAGPQAAMLGATAMIDVSDGLIADLGHVAAASGVQIDIRLDDLAAVSQRPGVLREAAGRTGFADWRDWVLAGGEDHALAATFGSATTLPAPWAAVGMVAAGTGVTVDGTSRSDLAGWDHFRTRHDDYSP